MWSRIDQGPGIHFVTSAVLKKRCYIRERYSISNMFDSLYIDNRVDHQPWSGDCLRPQEKEQLRKIKKRQNTNNWSCDAPMNAWVFVVSKSEIYWWLKKKKEKRFNRFKLWKVTTDPGSSHQPLLSKRPFTEVWRTWLITQLSPPKHWMKNGHAVFVSEHLEKTDNIMYVLVIL